MDDSVKEKEDCIYYDEYQDMGARFGTCDFDYPDLKPVDCTNCKKYLTKNNIIAKLFLKLLKSDKEKIVYCKDCKHRPYYNEKTDEVLPPLKNNAADEFDVDDACPFVADTSDPFYNYIPKDDFYCANGKEKDEVKIKKQLKNLAVNSTYGMFTKDFNFKKDE